MAGYKNPEMRKATEKMKEMPKRSPGPKVKKPAVSKSIVKPTLKAKPKAKPLGEKPPAGSDAYAKKKFGKNSWNNGYTN